MELGFKKQYIDKIKEQKHLIAFQKMILDITFDFMDINQENFDERVNNLLESIDQFFEADRSYLFTINVKKDTIIYSHEWCATGIREEVGTINEIPMVTYSWWFDQLEKNNTVHIEDVTSMPEAASAERDKLLKQEVKSLLSVPIVVDGETLAFIGIDTVTIRKKWIEEDIELLHIMANILSRGFSQLNQLAEINFLADHDTLTGLPKRLLLTKKLEKGIQKARLQKHSVSILFINLDGFKRINDTLGYHQGNDLLKQVSERLLSVFSKEDSVYRTDGDQFFCISVIIKTRKNLILS